MRRPVCYDVTRLLTRILNATPNGIDRVDHALAQHFLAGNDADRTYGATATGLGARLMSGPAAREAVAGIAAHWGETGRDIADDPAYRRVVDWLKTGTAAAAPVRRRKRRSSVDVAGIAGWIGRHGLPLRTPRRHLPRGTLYVNASQFPLWVAASFAWLEARRDVRAVFFIHDLLPILMPEYFRKAELERHRARLRNFARFAAAAVVTTPTVAGDLGAHMAGLGRKDVPVFVAPTPISPTFATARVIDPALAGHPFFVLCSTLEPRKNHLMILAVWRALVARLGREAPKLILVGTRGWHYDAIIDLIERSPVLHGHVMEVGGLSTPGLKRLIDNAQAVLMPTFGEGYGLPVHEALTAGAPVVASDIPVFRGLAGADLTLLSPLDGDAWLETIAARTRAARSEEGRSPDSPRPDSPRPKSPLGTWESYFEALESFLEAL